MSHSADIVIPTHDHSRLLPFALRSAQEQSITDVRIVVIGDGVGDDTRDVVRGFVRDDDRVTFHDLPKAGRTGEPHRHPIVTNSTAGIITYLGDDDLLLPDHVETMLALLAGSDVATPPATHLRRDGTVSRSPWSLADEVGRRAALGGIGLFSLTGLSHTTAAYRRLPHGWRETPAQFSTDQFMILQFLEQSWCRFALADTPTTVHLPSFDRRDMSPEERFEELATVDARMRGAGGWAHYRHLADEDLRLQALSYSIHMSSPDAEIERLRAELALTVQHAANLQFQNEARTQEIAGLEADARQVRAELAELRATRTVRIRDRLLRSRLGRLATSRRRSSP